MLKQFLFVLAIGGLFFACANEAATTEEASMEHEGEEHATAEMEEGDGKHFGETITEDGAMEFETLLTEMNQTDSLPAKVVATVSEVCQMKGCWMNIEADGKEEKMFVQFKDYGFFVPKDIAGRKVIMDGYAYREVTPVEELRHFAEDEGKSEEEVAAITEPKEELKFLASGVILLDEEGE